MRRAVLLAACGLVVCASAARGAELQIDAPRFRFDQALNTYYYQDARITLGELVLDAKSIVINLNTRMLDAGGDVRFREGPIFGTGDRMTLNLDTTIGEIANAHIYDGESKYYLTGKIIERTGPRTFALQECSLTTCPPRIGGWSLAAARLEFHEGDYVIGTNATLEVGRLPIFWFPLVAWPAVQKRRTGFLSPELSVQDSSLARLRSGTRLSIPYFIALGEDHDLTLFPEYITERGPALGAEYRYAFVGDQRGQLRIWGVQETLFRDAAQENDILLPGEAARRSRYPQRYMLDFGQTQSFAERSRLTLYAQASSDGQVRREYDGVTNYRPYRVFQGTLTHQADWGNSAVTLERRIEYTSESLYADDLRFTDADLRPLLLPRVTYNVGFRPAELLPLAIDMDAFVTQFSTRQGVGGKVSGARPTVTMPVSLFGVAELIPTASRQFVQYDALVYGNPEAQNTSLPSVGYAQDRTELELRFPFARIFPQASGGWSDIKHTFTPRLIRTSVEDVSQPYGGFVVEQGYGMQLMTFRLDNLWQGRVKQPAGDYSFQQLGTLNLIQRYNLLLERKQFFSKGPQVPSPQETDPGEPLLPAILEGTITGRNLTLGLLLRYHHQRASVTETRISASGVVDVHSTLAVSYVQNDITYRTPDNKLFPAGTTLGFGGEFTATDVVSAGLSGTINLEAVPAPLNRRIQNGRVFVDYHAACYSLRFSYEEFIDSYVERAVVRYLVESRFLITLNLGGLFNISTRTRLGTGDTVISPGL